MDKIRNKTSTISQTRIEGSRKLAIEGESYKIIQSQNQDQQHGEKHNFVTKVI